VSASGSGDGEVGLGAAGGASTKYRGSPHCQAHSRTRAFVQHAPEGIKMPRVILGIGSPCWPFQFPRACSGPTRFTSATYPSPEPFKVKIRKLPPRCAINWHGPSINRWPSTSNKQSDDFADAELAKDNIRDIRLTVRTNAKTFTITSPPTRKHSVSNPLR